MDSSELFKDYMAMDGVTPAKMFGWECLEVNGNVFVCRAKDMMLFKLAGAPLEKALNVPGIDYFDPMKNGVKMKAWVAASDASALAWPELFRESLEYVKTLPAKEKKVKTKK